MVQFPFFLRRRAEPAARPTLPAIPSGQRVYAIGDVHGCADELGRLLDMINGDHAARTPAERTVVFLGDLVNRGPDSARTVERARALVASGEGRLLKGNHEELFVLAARGDRQALRTLMANGGMATLVSFGFTPDEVEHGSYGDLAALLKSRLPHDVVSFLDAGEDKIAIGDYLFVHAGVRPGVPIEEQEGADLRWIRTDFLSSSLPHGAMVVHGHTIRETVEVQDNRIGIDTGAFRSGVLTAIGLEGTDRWFLSTPSTTSRGLPHGGA